MHDLDAAHAHLGGEYRGLLSIAFGGDERVWSSASPARFEPAAIADAVRRAGGPTAILLEQSADDQLVPMSQRDALMRSLEGVKGLTVAVGDRCSGSHAAAWEQGDMLWQSVCDVLALCRHSHLAADHERTEGA